MQQRLSCPTSIIHSKSAFFSTVWVEIAGHMPRSTWPFWRHFWCGMHRYVMKSSSVIKTLHTIVHTQIKSSSKRLLGLRSSSCKGSDTRQQRLETSVVCRWSSQITLDRHSLRVQVTSNELRSKQSKSILHEQFGRSAWNWMMFTNASVGSDLLTKWVTTSLTWISGRILTLSLINNYQMRL